MLSTTQLDALLRINPNKRFEGDVHSEEGMLHERYRFMSKAVHAVRPHGVRRCVPGLFEEGEEELDDELLCLPMLQRMGVGREKGRRERLGVEVEVRYRKVDTGGRKLKEILG